MPGSRVLRLTAPALTDTAALVRSCRSTKRRLSHPRQPGHAKEPRRRVFDIQSAADKAGSGPPALIGEVSPARSGAARAPFRLVLLFSLLAKQPLLGKTPVKKREVKKKNLKKIKRNKSVVFNPPTALPSRGVSVLQALAARVSVHPGVPPAPIPGCPSLPHGPRPGGSPAAGGKDGGCRRAGCKRIVPEGKG